MVLHIQRILAGVIKRNLSGTNLGVELEAVDRYRQSRAQMCAQGSHSHDRVSDSRIDEVGLVREGTSAFDHRRSAPDLAAERSNNSPTMTLCTTDPPAAVVVAGVAADEVVAAAVVDGAATDEDDVVSGYAAPYWGAARARRGREAAMRVLASMVTWRVMRYEGCG